jgi:hypothetical protein
LRPLVPILVEAMERHGHRGLHPRARQITGDERGNDQSGLQDIRRQVETETRRRSAPREE